MTAPSTEPSNDQIAKMWRDFLLTAGNLHDALDRKGIDFKWDVKVKVRSKKK